MPVDIEALIKGVKINSGCSVMTDLSDSTYEEALEFLVKVTELRKSGTRISPTKVSKALEDNWGVLISARRVSDHLRGDCACRKTK